MKCPKCGYLGFEQVERCRNCGYEFSLATPLPDADLSLKELVVKGNGQSNPLEDLSFLKEVETRAVPQSPSDLPLFQPASADDEPLITRPSPPRQPLAVRRATPETPRPRAEPRAQSFDLAFDVDPASSPSVSTPMPPLTPREAGRSVLADGISLSALSSRPASISPESPFEQDQRANASLVARFFAAVIDLLILVVVDVLVVYFTIELCGISFFEIGILPKAPLLAFLMVQNGGYLVGFTAGGQTLGKMVMGIRVVSADEGEPLSVGRALQRTLLWAVLAIPAGLGFLTAIFSSDRRGLHDRLAGTRVVRASA
jgi:uncharacterized RDD family membrane protein YckC